MKMQSSDVGYGRSSLAGGEREPEENRTPEAVRVRLLGGFRVSVGSRTVRQRDWRLKKAAALVKLLALSPRHALHREVVMDHLWPGLDADAAANNLHRTLHSARRALDPLTPAANSSYLRLEDDQLRLCPEAPLWVDAEVFEEAAVRARRSGEPAVYRAAIELYAGELLPGDRYEEWAEERREGLRRTYLSLLLEMATLHEEGEDYGPATRGLEKVIAEEPTHEEAHVRLIRLYALDGRRGQALEQYERLRDELRRALDREPGTAGLRLYEEILADRFPPARPPGEHLREDGDRRHNLPGARTKFIGREQEMLEIKRLLSMTRLLTLTGAGGSGKTRLALEIARDLVGAYPDGVWLAELAPLSDPELVPNAVATALGVHEQPGRSLEDALADFLRPKQMLLVLDNCEHLIEACAELLDKLLNSCERLRVLATSREALGIAGEVNWLVPSLSVPDTDRVLTVPSLTRYESVRLFVDRARSRLPTFELTPENTGAVAEVCCRLDGIPLAIELATARMSALAVDQIAERLEDSLGLLTTGSRTAATRQRTLKATLEWSYELLNGPEQELFRRLSVFAGGWTLEAAEEVCSGIGQREVRVSNPPIPNPPLLDLLGRLVDKSLVVAEAGGDGALRYRMLEPVRQYGWEKLAASAGETERVRDLHARYYLELVEVAEPELVGAGQVAWLERLATEYANLRAALHWFLNEEGAKPEERANMGLRMAAALGRFWSVHNPSEGGAWLEKGLARSDGSPGLPRATALREAGLIAIYQLDPRAMEMLDEGQALFKELGDHLGQAASIHYMMHGIGILGRHERLPALRQETEALLGKSPEDRRVAAYLQLTLGMMAMIEEGRHQLTRLQEALALFREVGDLRSCAMCLTIMGIDALSRRDTDLAGRAFEETLGLLWQLKDRIGTFYSLMGAAGVAALRGQPARAARLSGAAEALRKALGHPVQPLKNVHYDYDSYIATIRAELGEAAFEAAFSEGERMSPEQAIEYALSSEEPAPLAPPSPEEPPSALSRREREVALLVARGLTNRQIASQLSISERTVTTHVDHILTKLGAASRAQVAAWVVEQRPLPEEAGSG
jgi:predicted ATPase/DNA-binding SARP family transcriptional activator/DNA-binding CsgD family transcriptional regulator